VSSQASGGYHAIAPLAYRGSAATAMKALADIVRATPRTSIVSHTHDYLYAEFQSALVGFVDDVEFWFPPGGQIIHVRSASRLGHSDLGANRKRIEDVRNRLGAAGV